MSNRPVLVDSASPEYKAGYRDGLLFQEEALKHRLTDSLVFLLTGVLLGMALAWCIL